MERWTSLEGYLIQLKKFLARLESNPDLFAFTRKTEKVKESAKKEVNFNPSKDIFLSPYDFSGGGTPVLYSNRCERRLATWVYGAKTKANTMSAGFDISEPTSDYSLIVSGQDDDAEKKCRIRITVNNNKVFEGENPFVRFGWSLHGFTIKAPFLIAGHNSISIRNIEDSSNSGGPPFCMLNYAVIREK